MPLELFLAWRYMRFNTSRTFLSVITWISILGVAVGTAALVIALSLNAGFVKDITERIHGGSAHLTVLASDGEEIDQPQGLLQLIEQVDGVEAAAPVVYTVAMLTRTEAGSPEFVELLGVDPRRQGIVVQEGGWDANPFPALEDPTLSGRASILVGETLARKLGVVPGDTVHALVPQVTLAGWGPVPRQKVFEVGGVYKSSQFEQDSRRAYVDTASAQQLLRMKGKASWAEVRLQDLSDLGPMKERLQSSLGEEWRVIDLLDQNQDFLKALNTEKMMLFLAIGLIVVVASLNIVSTLILTVNDKIKEIGALTALGTAPRAIAMIFVIQGLMVGFAGVVVGIPLGWTVAEVLDRFQLIPLDEEVYYLSHVPFHVHPSDVLLVGIAAMFIGLVATIYPAWKAATLNPVEALRHE